MHVRQLRKDLRSIDVNAIEELMYAIDSQRELSHGNLKGSYGNLRGKHQWQVKAALLDLCGCTLHLQLIEQRIDVVVLLGDNARLHLKGLEDNVDCLQEVERNHCIQPPLLWRRRWVRLLKKISAHGGSFC